MPNKALDSLLKMLQADVKIDTRAKRTIPRKNSLTGLFIIVISFPHEKKRKY
ncbi:hypothetical protein HYU19_04535 [Candidatus Woesearchaeota archaeon]|nr:hypothetical protein [Candidatus Woesearchaeota archaeon]